MENKVASFIKTTLIVWLGILLPLAGCLMFLKASIKDDTFRAVDTYIENENVNLSKYIELQFSNASHDIQKLGAFVESCDDVASTEACISEYMKNHKETNYVNIYDQTGKLIASSQKQESEVSLDKEEMNCKTNEINYKLVENSDKTVSLVLFMAQQKPSAKERGFVKVDINWKDYEKYMGSITVGPFPRMLYIISPACKRYVSCTALPRGWIERQEVMALGMHLAEKILSFVNGLSSASVASAGFRLMKSEIKLPKTMHGPKFFLVSAMDNDTLEKVAEDFLSGLPVVISMLVAVILFIGLILSKAYNKISGNLAVANKISDSTPLAIAIFRADTGKIQKINLTARTLLRIQEENILKINMWDFFISDSDREYVRNAIESDINVFNYEVLAQSFGGGTFWSVCSVSPVMIDEIKYIMLGVLDINRRKEVEKKLANNAEMLEKQVAERTADLEKNAAQLQTAVAELEEAKAAADTANNAKSAFLANVSNELKTPLNAIIGYSEILQEEAEDRKDNVTADDLRKIIGAARHLLSLINGILDLSQIEAGKIQLFFETFSVKDMMKDVESVIMPLVTDNNNSLYLEHSKDIGTMHTDSIKLRQCLLNLLSNAAKFTEFGKVTLRASAVVKDGEDFIEFSVVDTGKGISEDRISTIFEAFQVEESQGSGTGLGLAVTKEYVGYLGGTISVESEVGVGSKFVIKLPRVCKTEGTDKIVIKDSQKEKDDNLEDIIESDEKSIEDMEKEEKQLKELESDIRKEMSDFEKGF